MKQVFLNGKGEVQVLDTPVPAPLRGSILVRTEHSLISQGTEGAAVSARGGWLGVYEKAMQSRERTEQVWNLVRKEGVSAARRIVMSKLEDLVPIGYSSSGIVEEVSGPDVPFQPGDRVACMGIGFASHADYAVVPVQLAARVPDGVLSEHAAFGAVACIAMQGIRRLDLTPGESIVVMGLGLIGQLAVQLASAMGYRVLGIDLNADKANLARECGAIDAWMTDGVDSVQRVGRWTEGQGADGVLICAGSKSDEPLNLAFDLCRRRGRVSVVGDIGMNAQRARMYQKELEMRISCSYGPGRYDQSYELEGNDYPLAHARWTEGRNLSHYLDLLGRGRLHVDRLVSRVYQVGDAPDAYRSIKSESNLYGILFAYPSLNGGQPAAGRRDVVRFPSAAIRTNGTAKIRMGLIGCGGFTKAVHLPNLAAMTDRFVIRAVASRSGATATGVAKRTGAETATSDYRLLLDDPDIDAVLIATRHASHGRLVEEALAAGKHVFVEKPLAIQVDECERIAELESKTGLVVRVGFNRRFAPLYRRAKEIIAGGAPAMLTYRVNLGNVGNHWSNTADEGGRLLGEGCHFFDLFNWFFDEAPVSIAAFAAGKPGVTNPNVSFAARYPGGSIATLVYAAIGSDKMGKERLEAFCGGRSLECTDFERLIVHGGAGSTTSGSRDKGHRYELEEFAAAIAGKAYSVPGADAAAGTAATRMALAAYHAAGAGETVTLI